MSYTSRPNEIHFDIEDFLRRKKDWECPLPIYAVADILFQRPFLRSLL